MNYRTLLIVLLTSISSALNAQDHLEPTVNIFAEYQFRYEYYSKVRDLLMKDLSYIPVAQLVIIPSFSKEVIWQIQHERDGNKYYSSTVTGNHSIWYNQYEDKPKKIKAEISTNEISQETGELIKRLFQTAVNTVRYSPEDGMFGVDGTNYYFSSNNRTGTIWSPDKESKMDRLVTVCYELMRQTSKGDEITEELASNIEQLISELK